ncbi:hypothetical protein [Acinetobacter indicus]|uniref:hypothetical protein n=1 Tax=Acinetobacter indicus TaxID=756892 RepID=UPI00209AC6C2|nr:hypothetical protein [Acinetobacter indicus]MCO8100900.1 hypothetical protein [Acinetobacter indicus]MCO8106451.1 hypothetical protein [Acinetobacter indicus]MCO8112125.1 hypothetical protein [Acinetobacter indicus]
MKKRNKKYNPNKLGQIKLSKEAQIRANWKALDVLYEFQMDFVVEHVNKVINEYAEENNLPEDAYVPAHVTIAAYEEQDLIIALKQQLIKTPESWEIGIDSHFYNLETDEMLTVPFALTLPPMTHAELMSGCSAKVHLVDGIKTVMGEWGGLQEEMIKNWEKHGIPKGFELVQSQVRMIAQAHFKDFLSYCQFQTYLSLRDAGKLIKSLEKEEKLWALTNKRGKAA